MTTIREANARLCEIGKALHAGDFHHTAILITHDSIQIFSGAIAKRFGDFLLLWTEHHGYHVEHRDEIRVFQLLEDREPISAWMLGPRVPAPIGKGFEELPFADHPNSEFPPAVLG